MLRRHDWCTREASIGRIIYTSLLLRSGSASLQFCGAVSRRKCALRYAIHIDETFLIQCASAFTHAQKSFYPSTQAPPGSLGLGWTRLVLCLNLQGSTALFFCCYILRFIDVTTSTVHCICFRPLHDWAVSFRFDFPELPAQCFV